LAGLNATLRRLVPAPGARLSQLEATLLSEEAVLMQCIEQHPAYTAEVTDVQAEFEPPGAAQELAPSTTIAEAAPAASSAISGRADAYQQLQNIAAFLARIEPHSPVPSFILRAVEWGNMPFDALMTELMENNGELQKILWRPRA
jgi:type VI secretion system protein ImpA